MTANFATEAELVAEFLSQLDKWALQISPSRWTDVYQVFLKASPPHGYVRCDATPDLKAQHPENWAQIEADFDRWNPYRTGEA